MSDVCVDWHFFLERVDPLAVWHMQWYLVAETERCLGSFRPADVAVQAIPESRMQWWPLARRRKRKKSAADGDDEYAILGENLDEPEPDIEAAADAESSDDRSPVSSESEGGEEDVSIVVRPTCVRSCRLELGL